MGNRMWMIRGDGGKLYDDFRDKQIVGIGWSPLAPLVKPGLSCMAPEIGVVIGHDR